MYECTEDFYVDTCDGDGFLVEENSFLVEKGSVWGLSEDAVNVLGAEIHIENEYSWIEISREVFEMNFVMLD